MSEQFGFQQIFRQRAAIDRHERRQLSTAVKMQRARDKFFARAAFAQDQAGAVGVRDAFDHSENVLHLRRSADDLAELIIFLELFPQVNVSLKSPRCRKAALNTKFECVDLERFFKVIERAFFHRIDAVSIVPKPVMTITTAGGFSVAGFLQNLQAMRTRFIEIKIGDDQLRRVRRQGFAMAALPLVTERLRGLPGGAVPLPFAPSSTSSSTSRTLAIGARLIQLPCA